MEQISEKNKLNKGFKIIFIINCLIFVLALSIWGYMSLYKPSDLSVDLVFGLALIIRFGFSFFLSSILLIITTILGIINYRRNQTKNIRKKIIIMLSCIIIAHIAIMIDVYVSLSNDKATTTNDETITLNERQKDILEEVGLSTNYDELTISQKSAIERIEPMLVYLENKYNKTFIYKGYVAASTLEKEHLMAYPADGDSNDIVTVYSEYEDGKYIYTDDYNNIFIKDDYKSELEQYLYKYFGDNIKIFVELYNSENYDENNLLGTVWGKSYVFIDSSICDENKINDIANNYANWLQSKSAGAASSTVFCLVNKKDLMYIFKSNYEDKLRDDEIIIYEKDVSINSSGKITIY